MPIVFKRDNRTSVQFHFSHFCHKKDKDQKWKKKWEKKGNYSATTLLTFDPRFFSREPTLLLKFYTNQKPLQSKPLF